MTPTATASDDDGDCLAMAAEFQDSNGDGTACGPGDLGVDEDYSEQFITDRVNSREIYLIPMLNVDGNIYDREVFCPAPAWESCPSVDGARTSRQHRHRGDPAARPSGRSGRGLRQRGPNRNYHSSGERRWVRPDR